MSKQNTLTGKTQKPPKTIRERWAKLWSWDGPKAKQVRNAMVKLNLYPPQMYGDDPAMARWVLSNREALHDMIETLAPEDVQAVYELTRLLALTPESVEETVHRQNQSSEMFLAYMGLTTPEKKVVNAAAREMVSQEA